MSTSDKLTYLNGTKQALKESINNLGGDITSETTFREYAQELQDIYDNIPKTTDTGTNLSLTTLKGKMNIIPKGDTQQETTTGINLMDVSAVGSGTRNGITLTNNGDGTFTLNGIATAQNIFILANMTLDTSKTYTLTGCPSSGSSTTYFIAGANFGDYGSGATAIPNRESISFAIVTQSGAVLNNVLFKPMLIEGSTQKPFEKYTGGTASPNPSYPQEIEVVRGKNVLGFSNSSSKTKLGLTFTWSNSSITVNGTSTNTETIFGDGVNLKPVKVEGTYKVSGYTRSDTFFQLYWKDKNGTIKYKELKNNPTITFNKGDTLYQLFFFAAKNDILTYNNETFNLQLEKGSTATSFLPYNTLEVKVNNGNIAEVNTSDFTLEDNAISTNKNNGELLFKGVSLKANITYYLKFILLQRPTTATSLSAYIDNVANNDLGILSFEIENRYTLGQLYTTTYTPTKDVTLTTKIWGNANRDTIKFQYWITPDSNMNTYKPFEKTTQQLSLGDIELCKIGNYQDYLYKSGDKWYKKQAIGKHTFTGTETWTKDVNRFWTGGLSDMLQVSGRIYCYFNYFHYEATGITTGVGFGISSFSGQTGTVFCYPDTSITTAEQMKNWVTTHNVEVYYPLQTPNDIEITNTTLIEQLDNLEKMYSYNGTTNISSNGNLPMVLSVSALKGES